MRIDAFASQPSYWRHLAPIVELLQERGHELAVWSPNGAPWGPAVPHYGRHTIGPLVLVASWIDARSWLDRSLVYVEHGAGQTYVSDDPRFGPGYAGASGLEHVRLFLCPNDRIGALWRSSYPEASVEVVGCPALDRLPSERLRTAQASGRFGPPGRPLVAVTCHWQMGGDELPEGMPALPHFELEVARIAAAGDLEILGHAHPRIARRMDRRWAELGIAYEPDPDVVLARADLLVGDNTSLLYEAAAIDLPVLVMNAPWYRREVEHGLRFWSHVPGLQVDEPADFMPAIMTALSDPPELSAVRHAAARRVYAALDGRATIRAADSILALEGVTMPPVNQTTEVADHLEEHLDRLHQLGAPDALIAQIQQDWPLLTPEQRTAQRKMNDVRLRAEIVLASHEVGQDPQAVTEPSVDLPTEAEMDAAAGELLALEDEGAILDALSDDSDLAFRLFRLEAAAEAPRVGLLEAFASLAGIDYEAPEEDAEVEPELEDDEDDEELEDEPEVEVEVEVVEPPGPEA